MQDNIEYRPSRPTTTTTHAHASELLQTEATKYVQTIRCADREGEKDDKEITLQVHRV